MLELWLLRQENLEEKVVYTYNKRSEGILFDEMLKDAVVQLEKWDIPRTVLLKRSGEKFYNEWTESSGTSPSLEAPWQKREETWEKRS